MVGAGPLEGRVSCRGPRKKNISRKFCAAARRNTTKLHPWRSAGWSMSGFGVLFEVYSRGAVKATRYRFGTTLGDEWTDLREMGAWAWRQMETRRVSSRCDARFPAAIIPVHAATPLPHRIEDTWSAGAWLPSPHVTVPYKLRAFSSGGLMVNGARVGKAPARRGRRVGSSLPGSRA